MGLLRELGKLASNPVGYVERNVAKPIERAVIRPIGGAIEDGLDKVFTVVDGIMSDPKKLVMVGLAIAFPAAATTIGNAILPASLASTSVAGVTLSSVVGNTVINTLTNGGNIEEAIKGAVISAGVQGLTNTLQVEFASKEISKTLTDIAAKTTANMAVATVLGKDPTAALVFGGVSAAASVITNQIFESVGIKDDFDKLPDAAKRSLNAALVATLSGKDAGMAAASELVNSGIRTLRNGISLQESAEKAGREPLTEEEVFKYANEALKNDELLSSKINYDPVTAQSYIENIDKAVDVLGEPIDAAFATQLAKMSTMVPGGGYNQWEPKILSDDEIILAATRAEASKPNAGDFNQIYQNVKDKYENNQAIEQGWGGGLAEKNYYQSLYGKDFSAEQADRLYEVYANPPTGITQDQLDAYRTAIINDWDPAKSVDANDLALKNLLSTQRGWKDFGEEINARARGITDPAEYRDALAAGVAKMLGFKSLADYRDAESQNIFSGSTYYAQKDAGELPNNNLPLLTQEELDKLAYKPPPMFTGEETALLSPANEAALDKLSVTDPDFVSKFDQIVQNEIALGNKGYMRDLGNGAYANIDKNGNLIDVWKKDANGEWRALSLTPTEREDYDSKLGAAIATGTPTDTGTPADTGTSTESGAPTGGTTTGGGTTTDTGTQQPGPKDIEDFFDKFGALFSFGTDSGLADKMSVFGPGSTGPDRDDFGILAFDSPTQKQEAIIWADALIEAVKNDPDSTQADQDNAESIKTQVDNAPVAGGALPATGDSTQAGGGGLPTVDANILTGGGGALPTGGGGTLTAGGGALPTGGGGTLTAGGGALPTGGNGSAAPGDIAINTPPAASNPLTGGDGTLAGGDSTLTGGSGALAGGSGALAGGDTTTTTGGSGTVTGGSGTVTGGSGTVTGGSGTLAGGDTALTGGSGTVTTGGGTVTTGGGGVTTGGGGGGGDTTTTTGGGNTATGGGNTATGGGNTATGGGSSSPDVPVTPSPLRVASASSTDTTQGALPIALNPSLLQAAPVTEGAPLAMQELPQLFPQLTNIDPRLMQVLAGRSNARPGYYNYGQQVNAQSPLLGASISGLPSAGIPVRATSNAYSPLTAGAMSGNPRDLLSAGMNMVGGGGGGLAGYAAGGGVEGHNPQFITGKTGYYVKGEGDGQSDSIPAMLADGEYVFDADTVAALGNGSNEAGARVLDKMRENIRKHKRAAKPGKIPPPAKSPLAYMKG